MLFLLKQKLQRVHSDTTEHLPQANGRTIYATIEVPIKFVVNSPINGESLEVDLEKGSYLMAAAGPLDDWLEPKQHIQSNTAVNKITLGGSYGKGAVAMVQPSVVFVFSCVALSILN